MKVSFDEGGSRQFCYFGAFVLGVNHVTCVEGNKMVDVSMAEIIDDTSGKLKL